MRLRAQRRRYLVIGSVALSVLAAVAGCGDQGGQGGQTGQSGQQPTATKPPLVATLVPTPTR